MARVQVILDIEEKDLEQFCFREGCLLPSPVIRMVAGIPGTNPVPDISRIYRFQHLKSGDEARARKYKRARDGVYHDVDTNMIAALNGGWMQER